MLSDQEISPKKLYIITKSIVRDAYVSHAMVANTCYHIRMQMVWFLYEYMLCDTLHAEVLV